MGQGNQEQMSTRMRMRSSPPPLRPCAAKVLVFESSCLTAVLESNHTCPSHNPPLPHSNGLTPCSDYHHHRPADKQQEAAVGEATTDSGGGSASPPPPLSLVGD